MGELNLRQSCSGGVGVTTAALLSLGRLFFASSNFFSKKRKETK